MTTTGRRLLGRGFSQMARERVFAIPGGVEIERIENFLVSRRRVLFREAFLVTLHRTIGPAYMVLSIGMSVVALSLALFLVRTSLAWLALPCFGAAALGVVLALWRHASRVDVITIVTKRARVQIRIPAARGTAHEVYEGVCDAIREARGE